MSNYRTMKPRPAGSLYEAITTAIGQIPGGLSAAAEAIDRPRTSLHAAGDPDTPSRKKVKLSMQEAAILTEKGGVAIAEFYAERAGGVFVQIEPTQEAGCSQQAVASASKETGEAISAAVMALANVGSCNRTREAASRETREAISALRTVLAQLEGVANDAANVVPLKGA
mgnify:CR=1 FL=1